MARLRNHVLGITVISAGACAALPFRNEAVDSPARRSTEVAQQSEVVPREQLQLNLSIAAPQPLPTNVPDSTTQPATIDRSTTKTVVPETRPVSVSSPPTVTKRFEPFVATLPAEGRRAESNNSPIIIDRLHRIVDGDTLESLADQYLGDANRWQEILDQNESLLSSRELLPIGENLRIRGERTLPAVQAVVPSSDNDSQDLVPIFRD